MWTPKATIDLKLADYGVADAYVVLPMGTFEREAVALSSMTVDGQKGTPRIVYLTGQADLLAQFRLTDFRSVVKTRYPVQASAARVFNWIFSVPYADCGVTAPIAAPALRFMVHLRVDRGVYAFGPAEMEMRLVAYLQQRLQTANCAAEIQAGLGWADFIIDGSFDPDNVDGFVQFLFDICEARIESPITSKPVFVRMLTLLGYDWGGRGPIAPSLSKVTPAMFVRAEAGRLREAIGIVEKAVGPKMISTRLIDGRSDFVVLCTEPSPSVLTNLLKLDKPSPRGSRSPVQAIETHILFGPPPADPGTTNTVIGAVDHEIPACRCRSSPMLMPAIEATVPDELRQPIAHVQFLFRNVIRNDMSCCDVSAAVRGAARGLARLQKQLRQRHTQRQRRERELAGPDPAAAETMLRFVHDGIEAQQHLLELWYLISERMLRQRTTGSFDELFVQTDRAVVYRGSVQKFLYLADCLMNDFAARVSGKPHAPLFGALYDAVGRISSLRGSGLIRIPVRHLFTLPDVIPDLWHEVGVHLFYESARAREFDLGISEADQELYERLGDYYGDLVVCRHGFARNWRRFVISLTRGWIDSVPYQEMPQMLVHESFADLLARLLFVREIDRRIEDPLGSGDQAFNYDEAKLLATRTHAYLRQTFKPRRAPFRERIPPMDEEISALAAYLIHRKIDRFARPLVAAFHESVPTRPLPREIQDRHGQWVESYDGSIVELDRDTDLNSLFGSLYWALREHWMADAPLDKPFQKMAGLAKSATIEYHRRQIA